MPTTVKDGPGYFGDSMWIVLSNYIEITAKKFATHTMTKIILCFKKSINFFIHIHTMRELSHN